MKPLAVPIAIALAVGCNAPATSPPTTPPAPTPTSTSSAEAPRFDHALVRAAPVSLQVTAGGAPLARVRVTLRAAARENEFAPGVLYQGLTDGDGRVRANLSLRSDQTEVEMVLQKPGFRGPYDDETLRSQHGVFAPSSWRTVAVSALATMSVAFTEVPR